MTLIKHPDTAGGGPAGGEPPASRWALRRMLWARRSAMRPAARRAAERRIAAALARSPWLRSGAAIGLYVSRGAEAGTLALRELAAERHCRVYLPRITDFVAHRMLLLPDTGAALRLNRYRIHEPGGGRPIAPQALSLVLMPLVGFDARGNRLGNGAGYYDRLLAARRGRRGAPRLVGIAFECQRLAQLAAAPHDVPLDAVITERGLQHFARGR